jgi:hypothetical protein
VRIWPRGDARTRALAYTACDSSDRWLAQRDGYLQMPVEELLRWKDVRLAISLNALVSRPGLRVTCARFSEEVINGREVYVSGATYCRMCAGESYLQPDNSPSQRLREPKLTPRAVSIHRAELSARTSGGRTDN